MGGDDSEPWLNRLCHTRRKKSWKWNFGNKPIYWVWTLKIKDLEKNQTQSSELLLKTLLTWNWLFDSLKNDCFWNTQLVHVRQHFGVSFYIKIFLLFWFIQLIWPSKCLILTILTLAKCLQNLLRDSTWSVISIAKKFLFKVVSMMLKMPIVTFFWITLYLVRIKSVSASQHSIILSSSNLMFELFTTLGKSIFSPYMDILIWWFSKMQYILKTILTGNLRLFWFLSCQLIYYHLSKKN